MTYEIEKKILNNIALTDNEVNTFLDFICNLIRKDSQIYDPMDSECKVCDITSEKFGRITSMKFGCDVEKIDIKKLLQIPLTHYANIISFNVNGYKKTYLVDMTYSQFFGDTITLDGDKQNNNVVVSTKKVFSNLENELFVQKLRQNGFVELNKTILKQYIDAFLELCGVKNKNEYYINFEKLLNNNKIDMKIKK